MVSTLDLNVSLYAHAQAVVAVILESFFSDYTHKEELEDISPENVHGAKIHVCIQTLAFFLCSMCLCARASVRVRVCVRVCCVYASSKRYTP